MGASARFRILFQHPASRLVSFVQRARDQALYGDACHPWRLSDIWKGNRRVAQISFGTIPRKLLYYPHVRGGCAFPQFIVGGRDRGIRCAPQDESAPIRPAGRSWRQGAEGLAFAQGLRAARTPSLTGIFTDGQRQAETGRGGNTLGNRLRLNHSGKGGSP